MFTLFPVSFDMMKADVTSGKCLSSSGSFVKSKVIQNTLFWESCSMRDLVKDALANFPKPVSLFEDTASDEETNRTNDEQPESGVRASVLNVLDKDILWEFLSISNGEDDGCEYCSLTPVEKQLFPIHQLYTNGALTCPVLLAVKTAQLHSSGNRDPSKKRKKMFKGSRC